jgi:hypothetical protein
MTFGITIPARLWVMLSCCLSEFFSFLCTDNTEGAEKKKKVLVQGSRQVVRVLRSVTHFVDRVLRGCS